MSEALSALRISEAGELRPASEVGDRVLASPSTPAALEAVPRSAADRAPGTLSADLLGGLLALADMLVAVGAAFLVFHGFYAPRHGAGDLVVTYAGYGGLAALLLVQRLWSVGAYSCRRLLDLEAQLRLAFTSWTLAAGLLLGAIFLLHAAGDLSRGWFLLWYASGLAGLWALRLALPPLLRRLAATGRIARRGLALLGPEAHLARAAALLMDERSPTLAALAPNANMYSTTKSPYSEPLSDAIMLFHHNIFIPRRCAAVVSVVG